MTEYTLHNWTDAQRNFLRECAGDVVDHFPIKEAYAAYKRRFRGAACEYNKFRTRLYKIRKQVAAEVAAL